MNSHLLLKQIFNAHGFINVLCYNTHRLSEYPSLANFKSECLLSSSKKEFLADKIIFMKL